MRIVRGQADAVRSAPRARADFESGSIGEAVFLSPSRLQFTASAGSSRRPRWFYFALENCGVPAVRCELTNADECLGPRQDWRHARPVFSADGRHWERVARTEYVEDSPDAGHFAFTVPIVGFTTYVAYCYPYTTTDLAALLGGLPERQGLRVEELCRTESGRGIPYLKLGNHRDPAHNVWLLARQHAGETPASFTVEGLIQWFCRLEPPVLESLGDTAYHIVPMVDVDGVAMGRYGKDQAPVDFNRDWRDRPVLPEIAALLNAIRKAHEQRPTDLVVDIHAPHHGDQECYLFGYGSQEDPELLARQDQFHRALVEVCPPAIGMRPIDLRVRPTPEHSARDYLRRALSVPVMTLEVSYHRAQAGGYLTPRDYRDFGAAVALALHRTLHRPAAGN